MAIADSVLVNTEGSVGTHEHVALKADRSRSRTDHVGHVLTRLFPGALRVAQTVLRIAFAG